MNIWRWLEALAPRPPMVVTSAMTLMEWEKKMTDEMKNTNEAPFPKELEELVNNLQYRPGWSCWLQNKDRGQGSIGLTLVITTKGYDSYHLEYGQTYRVHHYFPVPPAAYNRKTWQRWLFDQFLLVEQHECAEFFKIGNKRPYAPHHGPGNNPYTIHERGTDEEARTMYTGEVKK